MPPRTELDEHVDEIRALGRRSFDDVVEIGRRLVRCRELLKTQRGWLAWIKTKFGWSRATRRQHDRPSMCTATNC